LLEGSNLHEAWIWACFSARLAKDDLPLPDSPAIKITCFFSVVVGTPVEADAASLEGTTGTEEAF